MLGINKKLLILFILVSSQQAFALAINAAPWRIIAPDLELYQRLAKSAGFFSTQITFIRTSLSNYKLEVIRASDYGQTKMSVASLCQNSKAAICMNASYFDEKDNPLGLIIHRGIQIQGLHKRGSALTGVLAISRDKVSIISRSQPIPAAILEAVQVGPRLIINSKVVAEVESNLRSRRTGICIDMRGRILMYITSSSLGGLTFPEIQAELLDSNISCQNALDLDGGGSSQLFINNAILNLPEFDNSLQVPGLDEVPVAIGLFPRS